MRELGRTSAVRLVKVQPFSVQVVNGDNFHSGSDWTEANTTFAFSVETTRYHVHFVKEWCSLPDDIHYLPGFKLRLLQPPTTRQNDHNTFMDEARGESSVLEEASIEGSAPEKRSDQSKPEGSAALIKQFDRFIRVKRVACSFRQNKTVERVFSAPLDS